MEPGAPAAAAQHLRDAADAFHGGLRGSIRDFAAVCVAAAHAFTSTSVAWLAMWEKLKTRPKVRQRREYAVAAFVEGDGRLHSSFFDAFWSWVVATTGPWAAGAPVDALALPSLLPQAVLLGLAARRVADSSMPLPADLDTPCHRLVALLEVVCGGSLARVAASVPVSSCVSNVLGWLTAGATLSLFAATNACRRDPPLTRRKRRRVVDAGAPERGGEAGPVGVEEADSEVGDGGEEAPHRALAVPVAVALGSVGCPLPGGLPALLPPPPLLAPSPPSWSLLDKGSHYHAGQVLGTGTYGTAAVEYWREAPCVLCVRKSANGLRAGGGAPPPLPVPARASVAPAGPGRGLGPIPGSKAGARGAALVRAACEPAARVHPKPTRSPPSSTSIAERNAKALRDEVNFYQAIGQHPSILRYLGGSACAEEPPFLLLELAAGA
jgi:hypothetical protein